jgi:enoyl-CoA hydratase/carnithine racemase
MVEADTTQSLIYEKRERVAYITINRPEARNALNRDALRLLARAVEDFHRDDETWVAILTGAGAEAFSAGADLKERSRRDARSEPRRDAFWSPARGTIVRGLELWKPIIAAVNGACIGGGLELALACDIRVAAEHATFAQGEVRWGLVPGGGGTQRLPRVAPLGIALEMLFTGSPIDAREAWRIGLVNHVVPADQLLATAEDIAGRICENGPLAVRAIKEAVYRGTGLPLEEGLRVEAMLARLVRTTEDSREGPRAFAEKRRPEFKAR